MVDSMSRCPWGLAPGLAVNHGPVGPLLWASVSPMSNEEVGLI